MVKKDFKTSHKGSVVRNPRLMGVSPLDGFDEFMNLSGSEQADVWASDWIRTFRPLRNFPDWVKFCNKRYGSWSFAVKLLKDAYRNFVVSGSWSEEKFNLVVLEILRGNLSVSFKSFENLGKTYDLGNLSLQKKRNRQKKRDRRI